MPASEPPDVEGMPDAETGPQATSDVETLASYATHTPDPEAALRAITALRERLDRLELDRVATALESGRSWSDIARAVRISRQAAHKRYAARARKAPSTSAAVQAKVLVTAEARRAVQLAREEARSLGMEVVGTEHLLLGILRCERSIAAMALQELGARLDDARAAAEPTLVDPDADEEPEPRTPAWRGLTPHARSVLERSLAEALGRGEGYIGVEHLLLAVLRGERGGAARTLHRMGISRAHLRTQLSEGLNRPEMDSPMGAPGFEPGTSRV